MREAHRLTRKDGAPGVDRQTADEYAVNLEDNLRSLLERAKSGTYRAPPVRRVHIPKGTGSETRPLGIPTFEDKVLQRAVTMVLEAVYEQDFRGCSYGFRLVEYVRPDRRVHRVGRNASPRPETFDFLGFTHYWGRARNGKWIAFRTTAKDRFRRALKHIALWCRRHLHDDVRVQQQALTSKLRGHYAYYGVTGNSRALARFHHEVRRLWCKWLSRRSQNSPMYWIGMERLLERYPLPTPYILRPGRRVANP
ncbi:hypothetical protein [Haliangium sp.]|uniref:hypothetical protein n=1 Tax=Haliangium sp. TaxID=2663208 RepID=UPI003D130C33